MKNENQIKIWTQGGSSLVPLLDVLHSFSHFFTLFQPGRRPLRSSWVWSKTRAPPVCVCVSSPSWLSNSSTNHTFSQMISTKHLMLFQGMKEFKCDVCAREFTLSANLKRHMLIHASVRPFQCHVCFKTFVQKQTLKTHMIVHLPVKPFKCKVGEMGTNFCCLITLLYLFFKQKWPVRETLDWLSRRCVSGVREVFQQNVQPPRPHAPPRRQQAVQVPLLYQQV